MAEGPYRALAGGVGRRSSPRPIGETGALPVPAEELHTGWDMGPGRGRGLPWVRRWWAAPGLGPPLLKQTLKNVDTYVMHVVKS